MIPHPYEVKDQSKAGSKKDPAVHFRAILSGKDQERVLLPPFFESNVQDIVHDRKPDNLDAYYIQSIEGIHLTLKGEFGQNGDLQYFRMLLLIGRIRSCDRRINCINLTTAQALKRAREIGVRKITGPSGDQLFGQFLFESVALHLSHPSLPCALT